MKHLYLLGAVCLIMVTASPSPAGEITISNEVNANIEAESARTKKIIPVDVSLADQTKLFLKTWVSGSINLDAAGKRVSERSQRTTYSQSLGREKLRLPTERLNFGPSIPELQLQGERLLRLRKPVNVLYREGPHYFNYKKLKEASAKMPLAEMAAKELARDFLQKNRFLKETDNDKIGAIYLQNRKINEEGAEGSLPKDYLVQQDVVFERQYEGRPVINSKVVIGLDPNTKEIILFKHYNWTPVESQAAKTLSPQELTTLKAPLSGPELKTRLEQKIREVSGTFTKATVKQAIPAWFQSKKGLIPVMIFGIGIEYPSQEGPLTRDYLEVINLAGSDDIFFEKQEPAKSPTTAPPS